MRASSLSDSQVITLLNRYFVPVYVSNEDAGEHGNGPLGERAEYRRIYGEALKTNLSASTVGVYVLAPDGHTMEAMHVVQASKPEHLIPLLERVVQKLKTPAGPPVVKPASQSVPPPHENDALVLHLTARVLKAGGAWGEFPVENWIILERAQWTKFLPPGHVGPGKSWDIDKDVASGMLAYFYPATDNNDVSTNRIERLDLKGSVVSARDGLIRVRLSGKLTMKHTFYRKDDENVVEANVMGFLDFDPKKNVIKSFEMITDQASYGQGTFGIAVRSVP
jgi:hypothetical protein